MAGKRPVFTENFSANLAAIQQLLGRLFDEVIPTLCRFPLSGRAFFARAIRSSEAKMMVKKLRRRLEQADDLREFIADDYLILYLVRGERIMFLSIKHHRQLSFDLKRFWL